MTDKLHFDDLTKITCPLGLLDDDTRERLTEHKRAYSIQAWRADGWLTIRIPMFCADSTYRAAPFTMPTYPWAAMHKRLKWCAVDKNGEVYGYENTPDKAHSMWLARGEHFRIDDVFSDYKPGTVDWGNSLQERPE